MKNANVLTGIIFGLIGLVNGWSGNWVSAGIFLALGAASLLADATSGSLKTLAINPMRLPTWRRFSVLLLLGISAALFGYQLGHDLKAKVKQSATTETRFPQ